MRSTLRPPQLHQPGKRRKLDQLWLEYLESHPMELPQIGQSHRPPKFQLAIDRWNAGEFHASHETWEEMWQSYPYPDRLFYLAMAKLSGALEQNKRQKYRGASKLLANGLNILMFFRPLFFGLETQLLSEDLRQWTQTALHSQNSDPPKLIVRLE